MREEAFSVTLTYRQWAIARMVMNIGFNSEPHPLNDAGDEQYKIIVTTIEAAFAKFEKGDKP